MVRLKKRSFYRRLSLLLGKPSSNSYLHNALFKAIQRAIQAVKDFNQGLAKLLGRNCQSKKPLSSLAQNTPSLVEALLLMNATLDECCGVSASTLEKINDRIQFVARNNSLEYPATVTGTPLFIPERARCRQIKAWLFLISFFTELVYIAFRTITTLTGGRAVTTAVRIFKNIITGPAQKALLMK